MKVEIWSDYVCPFCYIGKRNFELALEQFEHKDEVEVIYKSFQLDPSFPKEHTDSTHKMLSKKYGISLEKAKEMTDGITESAKQVGLDFRFENSVQANTFAAHRFGHFAKEQGKTKEYTERLLKAHFTDGLNVNDADTLVELAVESGLDKSQAESVLANESFTEEVIQDQLQANQIGIGGVPFFAFNRKVAISGAQSPDGYLQVLKEIWDEEHPKMQVVEGDACGIDGNC